MLNLKKYYIKEIFTDLKTLKIKGIFMNGTYQENVFKKWWPNGKLREHGFLKNKMFH